MQRFSKNRQAILNCLMQTTKHPDAEWIYKKLKPDYPKLSLGTVYRNLAQLVESGMIRSMGISGGTEHFDANVAPHAHVVCMKCGAIEDLPETALADELIVGAGKLTDYRLTEFRLYGLCPKCRQTVEDERKKEEN